MLFPSRTAEYEQSVISKMFIVIKCLSRKTYRIDELYAEVKKHQCNLEDFIDALDCLYMIGKIKYKKEKGMICVVEQFDNKNSWRY